MTTKQEAQDALTYIHNELVYIDGYLNRDFADWPNTVSKLKLRLKSVNEKLTVIFEYAREAEENGTI